MPWSTFTVMRQTLQEVDSEVQRAGVSYADETPFSCKHDEYKNMSTILYSCLHENGVSSA